MVCGNLKWVDGDIGALAVADDAAFFKNCDSLGALGMTER